VARAIVLPQPGGVWAAAWGESEDDPDFITIATIQEFDPPRRMVWTDFRNRAKSGPLPFEANFITELVVSSETNGAALSVTQDGFPLTSAADDFYTGCETGWRNTFDSIRRYLIEQT
jgi:hypothetical protein